MSTTSFLILYFTLNHPLFNQIIFMNLWMFIYLPEKIRKNIFTLLFCYYLLFSKVAEFSDIWQHYCKIEVERERERTNWVRLQAAQQLSAALLAALLGHLAVWQERPPAEPVPGPSRRWWWWEQQAAQPRAISWGVSCSSRAEPGKREGRTSTTGGSGRGGRVRDTGSRLR